MPALRLIPPRLALLGCLVLVPGCEPYGGTYGDVNVYSQLEAADGLDLRAVGELVKSSVDAEHLERKLNEPGSVNNLDLDLDGKVDFIHVTEFGNDEVKGLSLTVEPEQGETQEIATIEIEKDAERADVTLRGNEQIYGAHHGYHFAESLGSMLLWSYLFRPHVPYLSPFGWGHYPTYYGAGYPRVDRREYRTRATDWNRESRAAPLEPSRAPRVASPNQGKSAARGIKTRLRSPTASQRAFSSTVARPRSTRGFAERVGTRGTTFGASSGRRSTWGSSVPKRRFGGGFGSRGFRRR